MDFYGLETDYIKVEIVPIRPKENLKIYKGRILYSIHDKAFYFGMHNGLLGLGIGNTGCKGPDGIIGGTGGTGAPGDGLPGGTGGTGAGSLKKFIKTLPLNIFKNPVKIQHNLRTLNVIIKIYTSYNREILDFKSNYILEQTDNSITFQLENINQLEDIWGKDIKIEVLSLSDYISTYYSNLKYDKLVNLGFNDSLDFTVQYPDFNFCQKVKIQGMIDFNGYNCSRRIQNPMALDCTSLAYSLSGSTPKSGYLFLKCLECYKDPLYIDLQYMNDYYKEHSEYPDEEDTFLTNPLECLYKKPEVSPIRKCFENITELTITHGYDNLPFIEEPNNFAVKIWDKQGNLLPVFPWNGHKPFNKYYYEKSYPDFSRFKDTTSDIGQWHFKRFIQEPIYHPINNPNQSKEAWGNWGGEKFSRYYVSPYDAYFLNNICQSNNIPDFSDAIGYDYQVLSPSSIKLVFYKWNGPFPVVARMSGIVELSYQGSTKFIKIDTGEVFDDNDLPGGFELPEREPCSVIFEETPELENYELGHTHTQDEESSIWYIDHNLNTFNLQVECFDSNGDSISYAAVRYLNSNRLLVSFSTSDQIHNILSQTNPPKNKSNNSKDQNYICNTNNNSNKQKGIAKIYSISKGDIIRDWFYNRFSINSSNCSKSNSCKSPNSFSFRQDIPKSKWKIKHNLNCKNISVITYNENNIRNGPDRINIIDTNTVEVEFKKFSSIDYFNPYTLEYCMKPERLKIKEYHNPYWEWTCSTVDVGKWEYVIEDRFKEYDPNDPNIKVLYEPVENCDRSISYRYKYDKDEKMISLKWFGEATSDKCKEYNSTGAEAGGSYYYRDDVDIRQDQNLHKDDPNWEWVPEQLPTIPTPRPDTIFDDANVGWEKEVNNKVVENRRFHGISILVDNSQNIPATTLEYINKETSRFIRNYLIPNDVVNVNYVNSTISTNFVLSQKDINANSLLNPALSKPITTPRCKWIEAVSREMDELNKLKSKPYYLSYEFAVLLFVSSKDWSEKNTYDLVKLLEKSKQYQIGIIVCPIEYEISPDDIVYSYDKTEMDKLKDLLDTYRIGLSQYRPISGYNQVSIIDFYSDLGIYLKRDSSYVGWRWVGNQYHPGYWRRVYSPDGGYIPWTETPVDELLPGQLDISRYKNRPGWVWIPYNRKTNIPAHWEYVGLKKNPPMAYNDDGDLV